MDTFVDTKFIYPSQVENLCIPDKLKSLNLTSIKSNYNDLSFQSYIHDQQTYNKQIKQWTEENVIEWLKSEELNTDEIILSFTKNKIEGDLLIGLTSDEIKNELEISSFKYRKRLNESLAKLKIKYHNSELVAIADVMKDDIYCNLNFLKIDSEIKTFEIQNQILDQNISEINDYEYAARKDNEFKKNYDREERDLDYAKHLDRHLNGENGIKNLQILEKKENENLNNSIANIKNNNINKNVTYLSNNLSVSSNLIQNSSFSRATIINKTIDPTKPKPIENPEDNLIKIYVDESKNINKKKFNCGVCLKQFSFSQNNIEKLDCGCTYCKDCLKDFFINAEKDFTLMPPRCHAKNIKFEVMDFIMKGIEKHNFMTKLEEFECRNKFYCQNKTCSQFMDLNKVNGNVYMCKKCFQFNCIDCKTLTHIGLSCEQNKLLAKDDNLILNKIKRKNNWKSCPQCKIIIELTSGCNHIICGMCSYDFCYVCLNKWNGLRCTSGCELYSGKNLELMTNGEVLRLGLNRQNLDLNILNRIRETVRDRNECLHRNSKFTYTRGNCVNCNYDLYVYCYKCTDCNTKVCRTCYFQRLR